MRWFQNAMCVLPAFFSHPKPWFYAKSRSLYTDVSVFPSKWYDFYSHLPSGSVPMSILLSIFREESAKIGGGVDLYGWVCADVRDTILARDIYLPSPFPNLIPIPVTVSARDFGLGLLGAPGSTKLRPRL